MAHASTTSRTWTSTSPRTGSWCSPACPDQARALIDRSLSLAEGAVTLRSHKVGAWPWSQVAKSGLFDPDKKVGDYTEEERHELLHGEERKIPTELGELLGLGYLQRERPTATLSGGESQRVRMARYLGSSLVDMTYVMDEPSIGLHPHDVHRLNELLVRGATACASRTPPATTSATSRWTCRWAPSWR